MANALEFLSAFVLFGAVGAVIGQRKGRTAAGLCWGLVLGPIGWLLVGLGPSRRELQSVACPHCAGVLPKGQAECRHCGNRVAWINGRAVRPSRPA